jgi:hypothetical protein
MIEISNNSVNPLLNWVPSNPNISSEDIKLIQVPVICRNDDYFHYIRSEKIMKILRGYFWNIENDVNQVILWLDIMVPEITKLILDKLGSNRFACKNANIERKKYMESLYNERIKYIHLLIHKYKELRKIIDLRVEIDFLKLAIQQKEETLKNITINEILISKQNPEIIIT